MIVCTVGHVDLDPRLHHRVPVLFAYKLGWFPVQGWGDSFWRTCFVYASLPILIGARRQHRARPAAVPHVRARRDQPGLRAHGAREGRVREPHHVDPRAAQRVDPDHHDVMAELPGAADRRVPDRALLLDPGHRPRGDPRGRAQRFPGDQGDHRLRRVRDDGHQPARRPDVQGGRSARAAQMRRSMATDMPRSATDRRTRRDIRTPSRPACGCSPGGACAPTASAWSSLAIVAAFIVMMILSGTGLIAATGTAKWASTTRRRRSSAPTRAARRRDAADASGAGGHRVQVDDRRSARRRHREARGGKGEAAPAAGAPACRRGKVRRSARRRHGGHPRRQGRRRRGQAARSARRRCRSAATSGAATC